jgi:O-antigen/teichoic acid export membrane protein
MSAVRGVGALLVARVVLGAATLGVFAVMARTLSTTEFGLFGLAWSVSYLFAAVAEGGYGLLVVREVARQPKQAGHYLGAFLPIRLFIAVAVLIVAAGSSARLGWNGPAVVLLLSAAAANLQVVSGVPRDFLIARDRTTWAALHAILETFGRTAVILVTANTTHSVAAIFAAAALFHLGWSIAFLPVFWYVVRPRGVRHGASSWATVLARSLPFGAFVVLGAVSAQLDVVIVSALLPLAAVATLQVALRILAATDYAPEAAWRWAYPRLSRSADDNLGRFASQVTRLASVLMGLGAGAMVVIFVLAPALIPVVFGEPYRDSILPMQVIAGAIPLRYGAHVYGTALSAAGLQGLRARLLLAVVILTVAMESLLIVALGLRGAAIGIVLASGMLFALYFAAARRTWGPLVDARPAGAVGAICAGVVAIALWAR